MFSAKDYIPVLEIARDRMRPVHYEMLRAQYAAPERTVTAGQLAQLLGYDHYQPINRWYGGLGRLLAEVGLAKLKETQVRHIDGSPAWFSYLSSGRGSPEGYLWTMYPGLAQALEELGLVAKTDSALPDEICAQATFTEGTIRHVQVNAYERNAKARRQCIDKYTARCYVCKTDLGDVYGEVGRGYIHVHHLKPLAEIRETYEVDPIKDLRPVCPNCHAIIHRRTPPYSIEEVQEMLRKAATKAHPSTK